MGGKRKLELFSFSLYLYPLSPPFCCFFSSTIQHPLLPISQVLIQHPVTLFQWSANRLMRTHSLNQAEGQLICLDSCYKKKRPLNTAVLFHYIITAPQEAGVSLTPSSLFLSLFSTLSCHFYVNWKAKREEKLETERPQKDVCVEEHARVKGNPWHFPRLLNGSTWLVSDIVCLCTIARRERQWPCLETSS